MFLRLKTFIRMQALRQSMLLLLIFLTTLTLTGIATLFIAEYTFRSELKKELMLQHQAIRQLISQPLAIAEKNQHLTSQVIAYKDDAGNIYGARNKELFLQLGFYQVAAPLKVLSNNLTRKELAEQDWLIYSSKEKNGTLSTAISIRETVTEPIEVFLAAFLILGISVGLMSLIAGLFVGLREQHRFKQISMQLSAIASGDLSQRIPDTDKKDDLGNIAAELNQTTKQLSTLIHQIKHLTQSIAHDLKTPLARLRAQLERALTEEETKRINGNPRGTDRHVEVLSASIAQTDQIIETFDSILSIARIQARHKEELKEPVPLAELVTSMHELYEEHAEEAGHHLFFSTIYHPIIHGDAGLLSQLLANLIENALRYSGQGSDIQIETLPDGLVVRDNGPGIPASEYEQVLQPMYQIDKSRNIGTGLGLAMVKAIADFHDANLELTSTKSSTRGKGLSVYIRFKASDLVHTYSRPQI